MLNLAEMIAEAIQEVDAFKKDALESIEKSYSEKLGKLAELEKEIEDIPKTCAGKSKTFVDKKRKQLDDKLAKLREQIDTWYAGKKKDLTDQVEAMLSKKKEAAQKEIEAELAREKEAFEMMLSMVK